MSSKASTFSMDLLWTGEHIQIPGRFQDCPTLSCFSGVPFLLLMLCGELEPLGFPMHVRVRWATLSLLSFLRELCAAGEHVLTEMANSGFSAAECLDCEVTVFIT